MKYKLIGIYESDKLNKKLMAKFINEKTVYFGQANASDYTIHKDPERKKRYIDRHKNRENWNNYVSAGALSRWILWNKTTLEASIIDYKNKFNL